MNSTARTMTTLPLTLIMGLREAALADRKRSGGRTGTATVVHHRNHVKRELTATVGSDDLLSIGYVFTIKWTGKSVSRRQIVRGGRPSLKVERYRTDGWNERLPYNDWENIRKLESEMDWAYHLAMRGEL